MLSAQTSKHPPSLVCRSRNQHSEKLCLGSMDTRVMLRPLSKLNDDQSDMVASLCVLARARLLSIL